MGSEALNGLDLSVWERILDREVRARDPLMGVLTSAGGVLFVPDGFVTIPDVIPTPVEDVRANLTALREAVDGVKYGE